MTGGVVYGQTTGRKEEKPQTKKKTETITCTVFRRLSLQSIHGVSPVTPFSSQENKSAACESALAAAKNSTKDHHKWTS